MVPVNRKDGQPDVDVFVFVVDSRPAVRKQTAATNQRGVSPFPPEPIRVACRTARAHLASLAIPTPASEMSSRLMGRSPRQRSRMAEMVWYKLVRDGRFS